MTDHPSSPDHGATDLEARLAALERRSAPSADEGGGRSGIEAAFWAAVHTIFPEEARKHMKVAGREQLLAARVYIDKWIERLDQQEADGAQGTEGRPHEKIDVA